jgi:hypothetical protein
MGKLNKVLCSCVFEMLSYFPYLWGKFSRLVYYCKEWIGNWIFTFDSLSLGILLMWQIRQEGSRNIRTTGLDFIE